MSKAKDAMLSARWREREQDRLDRMREKREKRKYGVALLPKRDQTAQYTQRAYLNDLCEGDEVLCVIRQVRSVGVLLRKNMEWTPGADFKLDAQPFVRAGMLPCAPNKRSKIVLTLSDDLCDLSPYTSATAAKFYIRPFTMPDSRVFDDMFEEE